MISLYKNDKDITVDPTVFCETHYADTTIWVEKMDPEYLPYWIRLHNCLEKAGQAKGRQYCKDYCDHDPGCGQDQLYSCYTKYGVDYAKEYCDTSFAGQSEKLNQCYGTKGVPKGEDFCLNNYNNLEEEEQLQGIIGCLESNLLTGKTYCEKKMELSVVTNDPPTKQERQANLKECYETTAGIIVDEDFCDTEYSDDDIEEKYTSCYVLFQQYRDRKYCE